MCSSDLGAVSGANLTGLTAGNLSGTIPSAVLGNSTHYVGTTAIALNRASASQTLTGVSIDGNAATVTNGLTTSNYNSYAPTLTGTGSSGTWPISVTGNAGTVTINYNNNTASTYQMLWGSGNGVYGTAEIYCNPSTDYLYSGSFYCGNWFRSTGSTGWYNESYAGGIHMSDSTYVRTYGSKIFYCDQYIIGESSVRSRIFYD